MKNVLLLLLCLCFVSGPVSPLWAEENLPSVEGILYEEKTPAQSVVIIQGGIYHAGDRWGDYEIMEIQKNHIRVRTQDGTDKQLEITGPANVPPPPMKPSAKVPAGDAPIKKMTVGKNKFDLGAIFQYALDIKVIMQLKRIYTAAQIYYAEQGVLPSWNDLIEKQGFDPELSDGEKYGYLFTMAPIQGEPAVYADFADPKARKRHYLIDPWGNLRYDDEKQATLESPIL